jgi:hypothetical protein
MHKVKTMNPKELISHTTHEKGNDIAINVA